MSKKEGLGFRVGPHPPSHNNYRSFLEDVPPIGTQQHPLREIMNLCIVESRGDMIGAMAWATLLVESKRVIT